MYPTTYKGWLINYDPTPIPCREFDWVATSPDFDADYEDGRFVCCSGEQFHARSYEELVAHIDGED